MLLFAHHLFKIHLLTLSLHTPLTDTNFWTKFYFHHWKPCSQTLQWHLQWRNSNATVSWGNAEDILGVVGNVIYSFVANLRAIPAVKEFWKLVKVWRSCHHNRVVCFFETQCTTTATTTTTTTTTLSWRWHVMCSFHQYCGLSRQHSQLCHTCYSDICRRLWWLITCRPFSTY